MPIEIAKCKTCIYPGPGDICKNPDSETGKQCVCKGDKYTQRECLNCGYCRPFGDKDICWVQRGGRYLPYKKDQKTCKDWTPKTKKPLHWKYQDDSIEWRKEGSTS